MPGSDSRTLIAQILRISVIIVKSSLLYFFKLKHVSHLGELDCNTEVLHLVGNVDWLFKLHITPQIMPLVIHSLWGGTHTHTHTY